MTLDELNKWIELHQYVDCFGGFTDSCGNVEENRIYEDSDGKFFMLEFCNNNPYEKLGDRGFVRGEYAEPIEVVKKQRMVDYYEPK